MDLKPLNPVPIRFYRTGDPYGEFSNFAAFPFFLDGREWPTSEHYFQAKKFERAEHEEAIRKEPSPMVAARMGRNRSWQLRPDWDMVRNDVMRTALQAKFGQHTSLQKLLLSTEGAELIEHTKNDSYWGDGGDGTGGNILGKLLMELRDKMCRNIVH